MTDLIARLEAATEGSRELDLDIAIKVGSRYATHNDVPVAEWSDGEVPHYSTSIDAAMTLLKDCGLSLDIRVHFLTRQNNVTLFYRLGGGPAPICVEHFKHSLPLAICVAALKARMT